MVVPYPYILSGSTIMLKDTSKAMGLDISWTRLWNLGTRRFVK